MPCLATQNLCDALERHVSLMRELVELSQSEQQHLMAFEVRSLVGCTEEKRLLTGQLETSERRIRSSLVDTAQALNLPEPQTLTVTQLCQHVDDETNQLLTDSVACLQALAASLRELQGMTLVQAERGQRFVRAYAALLRSGAPEADDASSDLYTAKGRARAVTVPRGTIARNA
jgi:flagellar biosynthesis/type III secretory pathway chaperone